MKQPHAFEFFRGEWSEQDFDKCAPKKGDNSALRAVLKIHVDNLFIFLYNSGAHRFGKPFEFNGVEYFVTVGRNEDTS